MQAASSRSCSPRALAASTCLCLLCGAVGLAQAAAPSLASAPTAAAPAVLTAATAQQTGDVWLTTSNAGELSHAQLARAADGSYIAVRGTTGTGQGNAVGSVSVRRLDSAGNPVGSETVVGQGTAPGVAAFPDGTFLVTWLAPPPATFSLNVEVNAQMFDAAGRPSGPQMSLGVTASYARPTALANGTFVLATFGNFSRVAGPSGFLRTYTRSGTEAGFAAELHEDACGIQGPPAVSALPTGGFAVAWPHACVSAPQVRMRVYDANGTLGASSRMTVGTQGDTARVGLAPLTNGNLVLDWTLGTPTAVRELRTLVLAPTNPPQSAAGATAVPLQSGRTPSRVQSLAAGGFVITWSTPSGTEPRLPVSRFSNAGSPLEL